MVIYKKLPSFIELTVRVEALLSLHKFSGYSVRQKIHDPWKISCKILQDNALFLQKNARFLQEISVSCKNLERNF